MPDELTHQLSQEERDCIDLCLKCYRTCVRTATIAMANNESRSQLELHRHLMAAGEICRTTAHFILVGSDYYKPVARACAEICDRSIHHCKILGVTECVDICQTCAGACHHISTAAEDVSVGASPGREPVGCGGGSVSRAAMENHGRGATTVEWTGHPG